MSDERSVVSSKHHEIDVFSITRNVDTTTCYVAQQHTKLVRRQLHRGGKHNP